MERINFDTEVGHYACNEMDTHADTCCAGANWRLLELTGETCEVSPFLDSIDVVRNVEVGKCGTVWTSEVDGKEYLLLGDQMLWFGSRLPNLLLNPNQMRAFGLSVCDDPWDEHREFGIDSGVEEFIPFQVDGTNIYFESRAPTDWEIDHLPTIDLTADTWDPESDVLKTSATREEVEMRTVKSLTSGIPKWQIAAMSTGTSVPMISREDMESDLVLQKILPILNEQELCRRAIDAVNIAMTHRQDMDDLEQQRKVDSVWSKDRHSKVTPEDLARKWNIGLETAQKTLRVMMQWGVRTAVHPLHRRY